MSAAFIALGAANPGLVGLSTRGRGGGGGGFGEGPLGPKGPDNHGYEPLDSGPRVFMSDAGYFIKQQANRLAGNGFLAEHGSGMKIGFDEHIENRQAAERRQGDPTWKADELVEGMSKASNHDVSQVFNATLKRIAILEDAQIKKQVERVIEKRGLKPSSELRKEVLPFLLEMKPAEREKASGSKGLDILQHSDLRDLRNGFQLLNLVRNQRGIEDQAPTISQTTLDLLNPVDQRPTVAKRSAEMPVFVAALDREAHGEYLSSAGVAGLDLPPKSLFPLQHAATMGLITNASPGELGAVLQLTENRLDILQHKQTSNQLSALKVSSEEQKGSKLTGAEWNDTMKSFEKMGPAQRREIAGPGLGTEEFGKLVGLREAKIALQEEAIGRGLMRATEVDRKKDGKATGVDSVEQARRARDNAQGM